AEGQIVVLYLPVGGREPVELHGVGHGARQRLVHLVGGERREAEPAEHLDADDVWIGPERAGRVPRQLDRRGRRRRRLVREPGGREDAVVAARRLRPDALEEPGRLRPRAELLAGPAGPVGGRRPVALAAGKLAQPRPAIRRPRPVVRKIREPAEPPERRRRDLAPRVSGDRPLPGERRLGQLARILLDKAAEILRLGGLRLLRVVDALERRERLARLVGAV